MPVVDVMMGKANQVPYDLQAQQAEEQRRALIMQQLLSSAQTPSPGTIPGTGKIVLPNYAGALGKVLEAITGVYGQQNVAEQQGKIAADQQRVGAEEAKRYIDTKYGGQDKVFGAPGEQEQPTMMERKPNPSQAITEGLGARTQLVREMARKAQEERDKAEAAGAIQPADVLKNAHLYDPNTLPPQYRAMLPGTQLPPTRGVSEGVGYEISHDLSGAPKLTKTPINQWGPASQATPTSPAQVVNLDTGETKSLGAGNLRQEPVNAAALELGKSSIDSLVKRVSESYGKLVPAVNNAGYLVDALDVLDKAYVGKPWSSLELPARKALLALGVGPDPQGKIPATEMITPLLGTAAFDMLKALRPASDRDVITVKEMLAIAPANDPETTKQVVKISIAALLNDYAMHGKSLSAMDEFGKMKEFEGLVPGIKKQYELPTLFLPPIQGIETPEGAPAHATMPQQRTGTPKRIKFSDLP